MPEPYPRELGERAVCLVIEHRGEYATEYAAIWSVAAKLGVATAESLRTWVRQAEMDAGQRLGASSEEPDLRRLLVAVWLGAYWSRAACSCFPAPGLAGDRPAAKLRSSARFVA